MKRKDKALTAKEVTAEAMFADPETITAENINAPPRMRRIITPEAKQYWVVLDALAPISHHDPAQTDKSNVSLFRRKLVLLDFTAETYNINQESINVILQENPVPSLIAPALQMMTLPEFLGVVLLYRFMQVYDGSGEGLFKADYSSRYRMLEERAAQQAITSASLFNFWGNLVREMQVPILTGHGDRDLLHLLAVPLALASLVLREIAERPRPIMTAALTWIDVRKQQSEAYMRVVNSAREKKGQDALDVVAEGEEALIYDAHQLQRSGSPRIGVNIPDVSANSLRHQMVREPSMLHLMHRLGVDKDELPPGTLALLHSGGGLLHGSQAPMNAHMLSETAKRTYPTLALLSGSVDSFMLKESTLSVNAWIICRENARSLERVGLASDDSIFDMIDKETLTRHPEAIGQSPMPFGFEALVQGAKIAVRFSVAPYGTRLQIGALSAAVKTFESADAFIGGQSARGYGDVRLTWHTPDPTEEREEYEAYLAADYDKLRAGLVDGSFCTSHTLCAH